MFAKLFAVLIVASLFAMAQSWIEGTASGGRNEYKNLSASCNGFTAAFHKELTSAKEENIVSSPFSIHMTLSLLSHGAGSKTLEELRTSLCHGDVASLNNEFQPLMSALNEIKDVKLYLANSLYIQDGFEVLSDFISVGVNVFRSEVSTIDFKNNVEAAEKINAWVKQATADNIKDIVSSDDFDEYTRLVLANAIYFKGNWLHQFDIKNTEPRMFHTTKTTKKLVPTMFRKATFDYGHLPELNAKFIEIPYMNRDIVMTIVLPNEVDGLSSLKNNFKWETLENAPRTGSDIVRLYLPRFKYEAKINLKETLQKIGMSSMFEDHADFSRMSKVPLKVSKVVHKAVIDVNEEGTEAAAATVVTMKLRRMIIETEEFMVDHPFMFVIQHKPSKLPLFLGHVWDLQTAQERDEL